jgi:hypothetical protein
MPAKKRQPVYGVDYGPGWVGFVHGPEVLSAAIAYLTRRARKSGVTVTHSFLVTGRDECVEANLPAGVVKNRLSESYFEKEKATLVFRRPRGLTQAAARRVVRRARAEIGAEFDFGGFVAEGLNETFVGHLLNSLFGGKPRKGLSRLLHQKGRYICTELVAYCLRAEPAYRDCEVLNQPAGTLTPQALFESDDLFDPLPGKRTRPVSPVTAPCSRTPCSTAGSSTARRSRPRGTDRP